MDSFDYNAPSHYIDFTKYTSDEEDVEKVEEFFETDHEHQLTETYANNGHPRESESDVEQLFFSPLKHLPADSKTGTNRLRGSLRKSMSTGNISIQNEEIGESAHEGNAVGASVENLHTPAYTNRNLLIKSKRKTSGNVTVHAGILQHQMRAISRDRLDKLAQPKQVQKYVSMAEAIRQFHQKTPKRFHTKTENFAVEQPEKPFGLRRTVPRSPNLATKHRIRSSHVITREEQEFKDFEEAQKCRVKPKPLNMKIFNEPVQPLHSQGAKPSSTKPQPFNLTQVPTRNPPTSPTQPFEFHAKPVPKSVLQPPKPIIKRSLVTNPHTPKVLKRHNDQIKKNEVLTDMEASKTRMQPFKPVQTKPIPFSFEHRDKNVLKKKDHLINEILEKEKKSREFHANPLPKNIYKSPQNHKKSNSSLLGSNEQLQTTMFKAKPAKVLQMKPFQPKPAECVTEVIGFNLSTEYRAKERQEFEKRRKEREEEISEILKQNEEKLLQIQLEQVAKIRKEAEYKAQPIRHYKDVEAPPKKPLTVPISPNFTTHHRSKDYNKENRSD